MIYQLTAFDFSFIILCSLVSNMLYKESTPYPNIIDTNTGCIGGGYTYTFSYDELLNFNPWSAHMNFTKSTKFKFHSYIQKDYALALESPNDSVLFVDLPLNILVPKLIISDLKLIAASHSQFIHAKEKRATIQSIILNHECHDCLAYVSSFQAIESVDEIKNIALQKNHQLQAVKKYQTSHIEKYKHAHQISTQKYQSSHAEKYRHAHQLSVEKYQKFYAEKYKHAHRISVQKYQSSHIEKYKHAHLMSVQKNKAKDPDKYKHINLASVNKYNHKHQFPPCAPSEKLQQTIAYDFCEDTSPNMFTESGCAVCGKLIHKFQLQKWSQLNVDFDVLKRSGVSQKQRSSVHDPVEDLNGPIMIQNLDHICQKCQKSIFAGKRPLLSLANGIWIGDVPAELSDLSYAEQLLIARVRHNRCIIRVSSGMHKMIANAIVFENPTPKIYNIMPPPLDELDEVLAFIYTGPCKPTKSDLE